MRCSTAPLRGKGKFVRDISNVRLILVKHVLSPSQLQDAPAVKKRTDEKQQAEVSAKYQTFRLFI